MCKICDHRAIRCSGFQTTQNSSPLFAGHSKSSETLVNVPIRNTPKAVSFGLQDPPNPPRAHSPSTSLHTPTPSHTQLHTRTLFPTRPHTPVASPTIVASASAGPRVKTSNSVTENKFRTVRKAAVPDSYSSGFGSTTRSKLLTASKVVPSAESATSLKLDTSLNSASRTQSVKGLKSVNASKFKSLEQRFSAKPSSTSKPSYSPTPFLPKSPPTSSFPSRSPRHVSPHHSRRNSPNLPGSTLDRDPLQELVHSLNIPALRARLRSTATVTFIDSLGLTAAATVTNAVVVDISAVLADPSTDTVHGLSTSASAAARRHFPHESLLGDGALHATVAGTGSHPLGGVSRSGLEPRVTTATFQHHRPHRNATILSTPWSGHHPPSSGLASPTNLSTPLSGSTLSLDPNINFGLYATLEVVASSEKLEDPYTYVSCVDPDDLLSHPDLGPPSVRASPPKLLPDLGVKEPRHLKKTSKDVENYARKLSSGVEEEFALRDLVAKSSGEYTITSELKSRGTAGEVRQQIRECLERVKSRRQKSSSESSSKFDRPYCSSTLATPTTSSGSASGLSNPSTRKSDPEHSDSKTSSSSTPTSFSIGSVRSTPERESVGGLQSSSYSLNPPSGGQPRSAASFAAGLYRLESLLRRGSPSGRVSREASPGTVTPSKKDEGSSSPDLLRRSEEREGRPRQRRGSSSVEQDGPACDSRTATCDASTITDVHQSADLAEVEIITLVQEQIPQYKLRADAAATAAGCSRDTWGGIVPFPALDPSDEALSPLSPDQAQATLDYFVACGNRVSQMTRTYNDIDAVTRLLEEKEKDLELAARIGQQLVGRNRALEERQTALEAELAAVSDTTTQLQHQLTLKTNLLSIYIDDVDDSSCETTPSAVRHVSVDLLQEKVRALQDDNRTLRDEAARLAGETTQCEERETSLMHDVIKQLDSANQQVMQLSHEIRQKNDEALKQHEETTLLLAQLVELQAKLKESASVNTELQSMVLVSRECQQELTGEIAELKERYAEVLDLLHDTQEQLRRYTKKNLGSSVGRSSRPIGGMSVGSGGPLHYSACTYLGAGNDSIASELSSLDPSPTPPPSLTGTSSAANVSRVFDTVKLSSRPQSSLSSSYGSGYSSYTPGYASYTPGYASYTPGYSNGPGYAPGYTNHTPGIAGYNSNTNRSGYTQPSYSGNRSGPWDSGLSVSGSMTASGHPSLDSGADSDMHTDPEDNYPASSAGVPGYPGTPDLNSCLRRIRPAHMHVLSSGGGEKDVPRTVTTSTPSSQQQQVLPYGCRTPDSIMATGSASRPMIAPEFQGLRYPCANKLQIIKPLEGSLTLHQWSRLAKPDLAVLLQPHRDGIAIKSAVNVRRELEPFSLSDLEEDEETTPTPPSVPEPRKQFMTTSGVFTYTNSTVMLVDDCTQPTNVRTGHPNMSCSIPKNTSTHSSTTLTTTTASPGGPSSSLPASRRGSTATFSTNVGLARVLQERGVAAAAGISAAAYTATPANSPEGSGSNTPVKGSYILPALQDIRSGLLYGATMIRRTLYPSPPSSPILEGGGQLLQRVTDLSLPTLAEGGPYHHSVGGVLTPRPVPPSPLMHLSKLIQGTLPPPSEPYSDLPSPELPSPGTRRPPLPYNHPLGMPGEPGTGQLDRLRAPRAGGPRRDLGTVPRHPVADRGQKMGQLGVMNVGRKGGLL